MHAGESGSQFEPHDSDLPLEQKLMSCKDQLDPLLMKKYIAHVRSTIQPTLSDDAKAVLKEYYLQLRSEDNNEETPITTRQLESLIRLTESRARVAQRCVATGADAIDVVEIFQHCLRDAKADSNVAGPAGNGKAMGVTKASKLLIAALNRHSERTCTSLFSVTEIKEVMMRAKIEVKSFDSLMCALNDQGFLLKKGPNIFQLQTSTCL
jgi:DNA helicase MCM8